MPLSALPEHLKLPSSWKDTDRDTWVWRTFGTKLLGWNAFGPRATEWWAKWREVPNVLFALFGSGDSRWEESHGLFAVRSINKPILFGGYNRVLYLSRVQYWCSWHIQLQWPLFVAFHFGQYQGYVGFKRDADRVYWLSLFIGHKWK